MECNYSRYHARAGAKFAIQSVIGSVYIGLYSGSVEPTGIWDYAAKEVLTQIRCSILLNGCQT